MKLWTLVVAGLMAGLPVLAQAGNPAYREISVQGGGSVRGCVRLAGTRPALAMLEITKDKNLCGVSASASRLTIGRENGVRDCVVYLDSINRGKRFLPGKPVVLGQRRCQFEPHVLILRAGEQLNVVNFDPVLHNVHAYDLSGTKQPLFNIAQPIRGQRTTVAAAQFRNASSVLTTCDAGHPWMNAYVIRTEHPYYAVTDADGAFSLDNIPPGSYTLVMWHEGVAIVRTDREKEIPSKYTFEDPYLETRQITIAPRGNTRADFQLSLR